MPKSEPNRNLRVRAELPGADREGKRDGRITPRDQSRPCQWQACANGLSARTAPGNGTGDLTQEATGSAAGVGAW